MVGKLNPTQGVSGCLYPNRGVLRPGKVRKRCTDVFPRDCLESIILLSAFLFLLVQVTVVESLVYTASNAVPALWVFLAVMLALPRRAKDATLFTFQEISLKGTRFTHDSSFDMLASGYYFPDNCHNV